MGLFKSIRRAFGWGSVQPTTIARFTPAGLEIAERINRLWPDESQVARCTCGSREPLFKHDDECAHLREMVAHLNAISEAVGMIPEGHKPPNIQYAEAKMVAFLRHTYQEARAEK